MKLILFLGSGVSFQSGLPKIEELTSSILRSSYYRDSYVHFSPGRQPDPELRAADVTPRVRRLLRLLKKHDERDRLLVGYVPADKRSSGAIFRGKTTTYEDLFYLCQQISLWGNGLVDNSLVTPLMETIERRARGFLTGRSVLARMSDLAKLAELSCYFIESVVAEELRTKNLVGFDLVLELATSPLVEQLTIVTLNHDTLVEQFLENHRLAFVDGFGKRDGDVRWYDDELYDRGEAKVKVLKLHGSVSWYSFLVDGRSQPAIFHGTDVEQIKDSEGRQLKPLFRRPSFLSGINKPVAYQRGIYANMHFRFHQLLRQGDLMVMSGYGWGDTAINFQLDTWLDQSRRNTIILLQERPEELVERSLTVASGYDAWVRSGQLIPIDQWLSGTSMADLESYVVSSRS